VNMVLGFYGVY